MAQITADPQRARQTAADVRRHVCLITRLRLDASLFEPVAKRQKGQMGRPALKGKRRPKLGAVLADPKAVWTSVMLAEWYGGQTRKLEYVSGTAVWYHNGLPPAAIRWVLVRDPSGQRGAQAFLCTDLDLEATAILKRFVSRWRIETTFQEAREHLGVETQRQWSDLAILRTTPALLGLYSLVTVWAHGLMRKPTTVVRTHPAAWYNKHQPTFSDAIAAVRRVLWSPPTTGDQLAVANFLYALRAVTMLVYAVAPQASTQAFTLAGLSGISTAQQALVSAALTTLLVQKDSPLATTSIEQSDCAAAVTAIGGLPSFAITTPSTWPITSAAGYLFTLGTVTYS